jgi:hypothetical protein
MSERYADGLVTREQLRRAWLKAYRVYGRELGATNARTPNERHSSAVRIEAAFAAAYVAAHPDLLRDCLWTARSAAGALVGIPGDHRDERQREDLRAKEEQVQSDFLREIFGNLFAPVAVEPSWLTKDVLSLAAAAYDDRHLPEGYLDHDRLAVLTDALQDADCTDGEILGHLRGPGPHVRGCWALDLIRNKK